MGSLKVRFEAVKSGWMTVRLESPEQTLSFSPSYTPYDSIAELINALYDFLSWSESETKSVVRWNEQPNEYEFVFVNAGEKAGLTISEISERVSGRVREAVFSISDSHLQIALPFWRALRDLQTNPFHNYEAEWRRQFPSREMDALTDKVKVIQEIERRLAAYAQSPNEGIPWEELKAKLINSK
ncbi:MAG: addiction module protein [Acidobacteriota bacterium]|nr:addiction module protein [Acidobacteriota bacterium]